MPEFVTMGRASASLTLLAVIVKSILAPTSAVVMESAIRTIHACVILNGVLWIAQYDCAATTTAPTAVVVQMVPATANRATGATTALKRFVSTAAQAMVLVVNTSVIVKPIGLASTAAYTCVCLTVRAMATATMVSATVKLATGVTIATALTVPTTARAQESVWVGAVSVNQATAATIVQLERVMIIAMVMAIVWMVLVTAIQVGEENSVTVLRMFMNLHACTSACLYAITMTTMSPVQHAAKKCVMSNALRLSTNRLAVLFSPLSPQPKGRFAIATTTEKYALSSTTTAVEPLPHRMPPVIGHVTSVVLATSV